MSVAASFLLCLGLSQLVSCLVKGRRRKFTVEVTMSERVEAIAARLAKCEEETAALSEGVDVQGALANYQKEMLEKLLQIRSAMANGEGNGEGGNVAAMREERDAAKSEAAALRKELEKANYRITHLVKSLKAEEEKNVASGVK